MPADLFADPREDPRLAPRTPLATCRLQFNRIFTFEAPDNWQRIWTRWGYATSTPPRTSPLGLAAYGYERGPPWGHLLHLLTPLYLGSVAAFLLEAHATSPSRLPDLPEKVGRAFEEEKPSLRARWG